MTGTTLDAVLPQTITIAARVVDARCTYGIDGTAVHALDGADPVPRCVGCQCHEPSALATASTVGSLRATAITSSYASSSGASSVTSFNP